MAPAWSLQAGTGFPTRLRPPAMADINLWMKGDAGLSGPDGDITWVDQGPAGLVFDKGDILSGSPNISGDIDGIPQVTCPLLSSSGTGLMNTSALWSKTTPRTVMAMVRPMFSSDGFGITGGPVISTGDTGSPRFFWSPRFELDDNFGPNRYYVLGKGTSGSNDGPSTQGGALGPFNNVPTLCVWQAVASPDDLTIYRNGGTSLPITPTTPIEDGTTLATGVRLMNTLTGYRNFYGGMTELIAWTRFLNSAELVQGFAYFAQRYPSAPIIIP